VGDLNGREVAMLVVTLLGVGAGQGWAAGGRAGVGGVMGMRGGGRLLGAAPAGVEAGPGGVSDGRALA
jgi:hypothetical protein